MGTRGWCLVLLLGCGGVAAPSDLAPPPDGGGVADLTPPAVDLTPPVDLTSPGASDFALPAPDLATPTFTVAASDNVLALDRCQVTPAELSDLPAGSYTIVLESSTLSKGNVTVTPPVASIDNYVIVQLPLADDDAQADRRFFMLNGIGASASFTLAATGTVRVMFVDGDGESNSGEATVSVSPGGYHATVSAVANVLAWGPTGCNSTPAMFAASWRSHEVTLVKSSLGWDAGRRGDYVLLRLPSIVPKDDFRYVILNGVDARRRFEVSDSTSLRAWFLSPGGDPTGQATLAVSDP